MRLYQSPFIEKLLFGRSVFWSELKTWKISVSSFYLYFNRATEMLGAITRQISRLSLCTLRLKPGSTLARAPTLRPSGLATPATQQTRLLSAASKPKNQKLLNQLLARPIVFRHYTTEGKSVCRHKNFHDYLKIR